MLLPPLAEQRRIVAKVEALLAQVNAARAHLAKIPPLLKRFRQSILSAACSARLTEDWRAERGSAGGWRTVALGQVATEITVGHVGPMANEYIDRGIPFLRSQNVREFRFDPVGLKFVSASFHRRLQKSRLRPGDIVIVRSGNAGVACVVPATLTEANCADLVIVRPSEDLVPEYACLFINQTSTRAHVEATKVGIAQGHFNIGDAREMPIDLPPPVEQQEIVRRVDALFKVADAIEHRLATATARADKLTQAILAKAFRGELVPTEAGLARLEGRNYEPASSLVNRIYDTTGFAQPSEQRTPRARSSAKPKRSSGITRGIVR